MRALVWYVPSRKLLRIILHQNLEGEKHVRHDDGTHIRDPRCY
jgi:hypothetical protein